MVVIKFLMFILAIVVVTVLVAIPIHLIGIRVLGRSKAVEVRDFLWKLESLIAIFVGALIAGMVAAYLLTYGYAEITGKPFMFIEVAFVFAHFYTVPITLLVGFVAHIKWRKYRIPGYCSQCGYDLTGNTSGICPECGQPASL